MQKRGKTSIGKQRWQCPKCGISETRKCPSSAQTQYRAAFYRWLCGALSQQEIAKQLRVSVRTLQRKFEDCWAHPPQPPRHKNPADILILDALHLGSRKSKSRTVLIAATPSGTYSWRFVKSESKAAWSGFLSSLPAPKFVVTDGAKPLLDAVSRHWPQTLRQRCMAHAMFYPRRLLRLRPRIKACDELSELLRQLSFVNSFAARDKWLRKFRAFERRYAKELTARWTKTDDRNHSYEIPEYPKLCKAFGHVKDALPDLFLYLEYPGAPRTTNHVEGGKNSRLRELLRRHRGLSAARKETLTACFLADKIAK